jgi:hypothetical protein
VRKDGGLLGVTDLGGSIIIFPKGRLIMSSGPSPETIIGVPEKTARIKHIIPIIILNILFIPPNKKSKYIFIFAV